MADNHRRFTSVEICAGAGGQAIGLERAKFEHLALVEIDPHACQTLRVGFEGSRVIEGDVREFLAAVKDDASDYTDLDLLAGGVPCPPFSLAGKQLGQDDERDLFPAMLDLVAVLQPKAVMIENVRGLLQSKFEPYRRQILARLEALGYEETDWDQFEASDFGVPQLRPRSILVALRKDIAPYYRAPERGKVATPTVGEALMESMVLRGMSEEEAAAWAQSADNVAPTLVGGSKKHGGADLGPSRAKAQWQAMNVDAWAVADDNDPPVPVIPRKHLEPRVNGPRLTVAQAARLQGFPDNWPFQGGKTARYRQVGNAFPPPVAEAVATQIREAIEAAERRDPLPVVPEQQQRSATSIPRRSRAPRTAVPATLPQ